MPTPRRSAILRGLVYCGRVPQYHAALSPKNAFYAQSGGVSAVINASACGLIETARKHRDRIGKVYAGRHGIIGALTEDMIDTGKESRAAIRALRHTPGGAFGSARYKLAGIDKNRAQYERLIEVFRAHDIGYFFYNGGNDSMDTAHKVSEIGVQMGYPITCIGIPKTVDNDLAMTDCCPGFGSAAKYIAVSTREAALDVAVDGAHLDQGVRARGHGPPCRLDCRRGRPGRREGRRCAAHHPVPRDRLRPRGVSRQGRSLASRSTATASSWSPKGVRDADGKFLAEAGTKDAFGHAQLGGVGPVVAQMTQEAFGYKFHWAVADYLQRSARHVASKVDVEQAYAVGKAAVRVRAARARTRSCRSSCANPPRPIAGASAKRRSRRSPTRKRRCRAISSPPDGFGITAACRRYLLPLIGGEDYPPYRHGLPAYVDAQGRERSRSA